MSRSPRSAASAPRRGGSAWKDLLWSLSGLYEGLEMTSRFIYLSFRALWFTQVNSAGNFLDLEGQCRNENEPTRPPMSCLVDSFDDRASPSVDSESLNILWQEGIRMRQRSDYPTFSDAEIERRHKVVYGLMDQEGIDAMLFYGSGRYASDTCLCRVATSRLF
jgi:hypothetical protein